MPRATSGRSGARTGYGLTCSPCRHKKVKCDGRRPGCGICLAYGESCHYDKLPSMSQILAMTNRIEELERQLARHPSDCRSTAEAATESAPTAMPARIPPSSFTPVEPMSINFDGNSHTLHIPQYRSTSAVDEPVTAIGEIAVVSTSSVATSSTSCGLSEQEILYWENAALSACASMIFFSPQRLAHLLQTHWTWVHPTFLFIPRPHFLRAASCGGEHFSTLLLNVICLHSTRFTDRSLEDDLLARVHLMLGQELHKGSSVPTVQALLQLSAREIGRGARSQAWLYSGMAFRSAIDLGCFSKCKSASEQPVNCMIKEQLAWSCYLWDKTISLYLGRAPVLLEQPGFDPPLSDPAAELMIWSCYPKKNAKDGSSLKSYTMSCFANFCQLAPIINDILLNIYAKRLPPDATLPWQELKQRLDSWRVDSQSYLKVDRLTVKCPPPHVLTQNLLYHTTSILLHRPFWSNTSCRTACREAAEEVEHLFLLLEHSFGFEHVTYLMAYCAYTAATVAVMDESQTRINTYLRALFAVRSSCPGIQSSIDLIIKGFGRDSKKMPASKSNSPQLGIILQQNALPAFPFDHVHDHEHTTMSDMDSIPFGSLGSFPFEWATIGNDTFNLDS
nr:nitrogen assimilation transcription factor nit-4 [Quercus suber]